VAEAGTPLRGGVGCLPTPRAGDGYVLTDGDLPWWLLPRTKQKFIIEMLDALILQQKAMAG